MASRGRTEEQLRERIAELELEDAERERRTARLERKLEELSQAKEFQTAILEQCRVDRAQEQSTHQQTLKQLQDVLQILTDVQQRAEVQCPVVASATAATLRSAQKLVATVTAELSGCQRMRGQLEQALERSSAQTLLPIEQHQATRPRRQAVVMKYKT